MSYSTTLWEGIVDVEIPQGSNEFHLRAKTPEQIQSPHGNDQAYLGNNFIGAELDINGHPTYTIVATTGLIVDLNAVKHFTSDLPAEATIPVDTAVRILFPIATGSTTSESSSSAAAGYTPGAPDVTEEYSISHGESTVKYSSLGGDVGITQKAVDDINAREGSTAETAIQGSYAEDAADAKLLNHARLRNQGQI